MFGQEIVLEIDQTLDQLIRNAETISHVDLKELSETELEAFQKTQESLLQHFIHINQRILPKEKKSAGSKITEKFQKFERLESNYKRSIEERMANKPIICKRRAKRFFDLRFRKAPTCRTP